MRYLIPLAFILSACASHDVPYPTGEWRPLNPGQWDMQPAQAPVPPDLPKIKEAKD